MDIFGFEGSKLRSKSLLGVEMECIIWMSVGKTLRLEGNLILSFARERRPQCHRFSSLGKIYCLPLSCIHILV